jgi:hemerythrin superfamily protein
VDPISLLTDDHRRVETLFQQFDGEPDPVRRHDVGEQITRELTIHAEVEETCFYPEARRAGGEVEQLTGEALHEHALVMQAIAQAEAMRPEDPAYLALMRRLKLMVLHHVQEEENELFPRACAAIDKDRLAEIGSRIEEMRKASAPRA